MTAAYCALIALPLVATLGIAVDFGRASSAEGRVRDALDAAVLAAARDGSAGWRETAEAVYIANAGELAARGTPVFARQAGRTTGDVSLDVETIFAAPIRRTIRLEVSAEALSP